MVSATSGLLRRLSEVEELVDLGGEDLPIEAYFWRPRGSACYAFSCSWEESDSESEGRLRKRVVEWRRPKSMPAVLGALALLPTVEPSHDSVSQPASGAEGGQKLAPVDLGRPESVVLSLTEIEAGIERAIQEIRGATQREALARFYAGLLSGSRGQALEGIEAPLSSAATAALLLPLARDIADELAVAGWVPSTTVEAAWLESWGAVLGGGGASRRRQMLALTEPAMETGSRLADSLWRNDPRALYAERSERPAGPTGGTELQIGIWGASGAGKTMLLARLVDLCDRSQKTNDLSLSIGAEAQEFAEAQGRQLKVENRFPPGTAKGFFEQLVYRVAHPRFDVPVVLRVEDRAGSYSEEREPASQRRLFESDCLLFVVDPKRHVGMARLEIVNSLRDLALRLESSGGLKSRPCAVCVSKADLFIETLDHYEVANERPRPVRPIDRRPECDRSVRSVLRRAEALPDLGGWSASRPWHLQPGGLLRRESRESDRGRR